MTDKLKAYSTTAGSNNSAAPNGWPEGMLPSDVNNCAREMMARLAEWYQDAAWIRLDESIQSSTGSTIVVSGDVTGTYLAGRPIRVNQSGSQVGRVSSSVYSAPDTTINVTGFTVSSPTVVEVGILPSVDLFPTGTITTAQTFTGQVEFSGTVTAATQSASDNSTKVATTAYVDAYAPAWDKLPDGVQVGFGSDFEAGRTDIAAGAITPFPPDGSTPAVTEGGATGLSLAYAAKSNTNILKITVSLNAKAPSANEVAVAVFAGTTCVGVYTIGSGAGVMTGGWTHTLVYIPGSTSSVTYTVRASTNTGDIELNQSAASSGNYGSTHGSYLIIEEIKA
jgi:hypothetical protein